MVILTVAVNSGVTGIFDYCYFDSVGVIFLFAGRLKMLSTEISLAQLSGIVKRNHIFYIVFFKSQPTEIVLLTVGSFIGTHTDREPPLSFLQCLILLSENILKPVTNL